jgi:hypothetical protein
MLDYRLIKSERQWKPRSRQALLARIYDKVLKINKITTAICVHDGSGSRVVLDGLYPAKPVH